MRLTTFTDIGLRALMYLATRPEGYKSSISEVTEAYDLSRNHVVKVVHQLARAGLIHSIRGKGGGIMLGKPADEIRIGQVVMALEESLQVVDCTKPVCKILPACRLKGVLQEGVDAFIGVLDQYTLSDLIGNKKDLIPLLIHN
ncbi:Rrf2 family transcriptional regulator [Kistimonas asteriae]|uniref:Rrf2 family transcriptional regulator n=1 Tax=Kistimonas asteriae TaxID=517724 RepID=UPI001BABBBD9|nr:Rrf2 family transcriptional regulator [Kistimonas asteriae]